MKNFTITSNVGFRETHAQWGDRVVAKINNEGVLERIIDRKIHMLAIQAEEDIEIRDEYHSMHELYQHRMALNIALFNYLICGNDLEVKEVMKSKMHNDGTMFKGYFVVMAVTIHGQISYHYKLKHWDKFKIPEVERTPPCDGHTSLQVMERLMHL